MPERAGGLIMTTIKNSLDLIPEQRSVAGLPGTALPKKSRLIAQVAYV